jgi:hypothetical protein
MPRVECRRVVLYSSIQPGHGVAGVLAGGEVVVAEQFELQGGVERLGGRVVQRGPGAAHRLGDAGAAAGGGKVLAGVFGGFNRSSQHLDHGGGCGTSSRLDGGEARAAADVVAGAAAGVAS